MTPTSSFIVNEDAPLHSISSAWLKAQQNASNAWYVTWPIIYEFLRVTTHASVLEHPWSIAKSWEFISALLKSPNLGVLLPTPRHAEVARSVFNEVPNLRGNVLHDAHTAVLMREHGIPRIVTRDKGFRQFTFLNVFDPAET